MKAKCLNCGLVLEKCLSLKCVCPECGVSNWGICINYEDTMMGLTMKARDKCDRESLERLKKLLEETYFLSKYWLEKNGYMYSEKMGVPENPYLPESYVRIMKKEEGLAFEIFEYFNGKKVQVRKIYLNGHIEGFKGDPCIINHIAPKILALKAILKQMNKDYRDLIERHLLADLPIEEVELSRLYQSQLERIMNIVPTI